jgi:hypothetical protein
MHHRGCCFLFTLFAICTLVVGLPIAEEQDPVLALMEQSTTQRFLRLCPDDTQCQFFGSMFDKPVEEKGNSESYAEGEQQSSFFTFNVKSNTIDTARRINQYEMKITMFMYADTKTIEELNEKVDDWDSAKSTPAQLHAELVKHAGEHATAREEMTQNPLYFKTEPRGKILNFCCPDQHLKVCA